MLVQFDMKLIHYTDAPDQLFNLTSDPDELSPLSLPYLSNRMLSDLNRLLSAPTRQIAAKVSAYDKTSFADWRQAQGVDYVDSIVQLRWELDFKRDLNFNLNQI